VFFQGGEPGVGQEVREVEFKTKRGGGETPMQVYWGRFVGVRAKEGAASQGQVNGPRGARKQGKHAAARSGPVPLRQEGEHHRDKGVFIYYQTSGRPRQGAAS
jgi:hypothetical protein